MANGFVPKYLEAVNRGDQGADLTDGDLELWLLDATHAYVDTEEFADDLTGGSVVGTYVLENVDSDDGELTADDNPAAFPGLTGDTVAEARLVHNTGTPATSRIVARWESASGLPTVPSGDDVGVEWPSGYVLRAGTVTS